MQQIIFKQYRFILTILLCSFPLRAQLLPIYRGLSQDSIGSGVIQQANSATTGLAWLRYSYSYFSLYLDRNNNGSSFVPLVHWRSLSFFAGLNGQNRQLAGSFWRIHNQKQLFFYVGRNHGNYQRGIGLVSGQGFRFSAGYFQQRLHGRQENRLEFSISIGYQKSFATLSHIGRGAYSENIHSQLVFGYLLNQTSTSQQNQPADPQKWISSYNPKRPFRPYPLRQPRYQPKRKNFPHHTLTVNELLSAGFPLKQAIKIARLSQNRDRYRAFVKTLPTRQRKRLIGIQFRKAKQ